ncbi:hypothetical protein [Streptomyces sp. NPDC054940]
MGELGIGLIAAGSALAGSALTGWFTVIAGRRQAAAARYAGDEQAQAVISTVQQTLGEQRTARLQDVRRQVYAELLRVAETFHTVRRDDATRGCRRESVRSDLMTALALVELEGPSEVYEAGVRMTQSTGDRSRFDENKARFIEAARNALI